MTNLYAALEIGTTRTVLAVGEAETGGRLKVTCHAEIPSSGVRKSQILDINMATQSIHSVIREIERRQAELGSSVTIGNAFLVVSGQHICTEPFQGVAQVNGAKVCTDEINEVIQKSRTNTLPRDREFLDIVDQDYELDLRGGISTPRGMSGRILRLNTLQIHADKNRINDARTAAEGAKLEIRDPLYAVTCAAEAVLEEHEKKNGVLVLDIGGGSTGYAAYSDGHLVSSGVIGVGGDHITNDIAHAFQTTQAQAEAMKLSEASAILGPGDGTASRVKIAGSSPLMESRMRELFAILRNILEEQDMLQRLHSGVVITGGGAAMRDIDALIQRELGSTVRIGRPIHIDGLEEDPFPASFAAIAGALLYAHRNYEEKPFLANFFGGLFK